MRLFTKLDTVVDEPARESTSRVAAKVVALVPVLIIGRIGWVGMKTTDTALLGHVSTHALSASALSDLWTSATGVLIQGRVLGIFVGNAIGAGQPRQAGEWFQVSLAVLAVIAVPVIALWAITGPVLSLFGVEVALVRDAWYFSLVLMACIPSRIIFSQLVQFFSAQSIVKPAAIAGSSGLLANLVLGLLLVIGVPRSLKLGFSYDGFGFTACPIVTTSVEWFQLLLVVGVFCGRQRLHRTAWPTGGYHGWSSSCVTSRRVIEYLKLYAPAALSIASDFWRFSAVGAMAADIGSVELAVFTASYRIMWISLTIAGSLSGAIGILLAKLLGANRPAAARELVTVGLTIGAVALVIIGLVVVLFARQLGSIFSADTEVLDKFYESRVTLALTTVSMNCAVMLEGVILSTGRARTVLFAGLVGSWIGQVPAVALLMHFGSKSLSSVYGGVAIGYALLCVLFVVVISRLDWAQLAVEAKARVTSKVSAQTSGTSEIEIAREEPQEGVAGDE